MVDEVRKISSDKNKPLVLSRNSAWPSETKPKEKSQKEDNTPSYNLKRIDPHRALFAQLHHPQSRLLIAKNLPPNEKQWVVKGLIEQALYEMEI